MNRPLASTCLALLGAIALCTASRCADAAEGAKLHRWAIIATEDKLSASVGDLLMARLSDEKGVELVERERLDEVLKEIRESAGINRLGIGNERVLQRRFSQSLWPRTVRW